ncbi:MAG: hypothetical protein ACO3K7_01755, partial [Candidatus Marinamargulisbacteria bacterium]
MPTRDIAFTAIADIQSARDWFQKNQENTLFLCLQPLVIQYCAHVFPLHYFGHTDPALEFERHHLMQQMLHQYAPKQTLGRKACAQLAHDLLTRGIATDEPFQGVPWLHAAVTQYRTHTDYLKWTKKESDQWHELAVWIQAHYHHVIFFGWDARYLPMIRTLINTISLPIQWVVPSTINQSKTQPLNIDTFVDDFFSATPTHKSTMPLHVFDTIEDEITHVLSALHTTAENRILVVPNEGLRQTVQTIASRKNIPLVDHPTIPLSQTAHGQKIIRAIHYIDSPTFTTLKALIYALDDPAMHDVKAAMATIESTMGFIHAPNQALRMLQHQFNDHPIQSLISMKSIPDIQSFFDSITPFSTDPHGYEQYQIHTRIMTILSHATSHTSPLTYTQFMLEHTPIHTEDASVGIRCILPESLCRYPNTPLWIMGFGDTSWALPTTPSYLNMGILATQDPQHHIRRALAHWGLTHPYLLGISAANYMNQTPNPPIEGIDMPIHRVLRHVSHGEHYMRTPP